MLGRKHSRHALLRQRPGVASLTLPDANGILASTEENRSMTLHVLTPEATCVLHADTQVLARCAGFIPCDNLGDTNGTVLIRSRPVSTRAARRSRHGSRRARVRAVQLRQPLHVVGEVLHTGYAGAKH